MKSWLRTNFRRLAGPEASDQDMEAGGSNSHRNNPESLTGTSSTTYRGRTETDADKKVDGKETVALLPITDNTGEDAASTPPAQVTPPTVDAGDGLGDHISSLHNCDTEATLHQFASTGNYTKCEELLDQELTNINKQDKNNRTPLHLAAISGHEGIVELLINKGAKTRMKDNEKFLPLHYAAQAGYKACCEILISNAKKKVDGKDHAKSQLDVKNKDGRTPFMLSVMRGHYDCCRILIGSDINVADKDEKTAMHYAASSGYYKTLEFLLEKDANPSLKDITGKTPILEALRLNRLTCVQLLATQTDLSLKDKAGKGVLHYAVHNKSTACLKCLLRIPTVKAAINDEFVHEVNPQKSTGTPLYHAISCHSYQCIDELLQAGASVTDSPNKLFPLHAAAKKGLLDVCQKIVEKNARSLMKINSNGETPLHMAAQSYNRRVVKLIRSYLNQHGINPSVQDKDGQTPLHVAAKHKDATIIQELVHLSMHKQDNMGDTALHVAVSQGCLDSCKFLISKSKAPLLVFNKDKHFPLDKAFKRYNELGSQNDENLKIIDLILQNTSLDFLHEHMKKIEKRKSKSVNPDESSKNKYGDEVNLEVKVRLLTTNLRKYFQEALENKHRKVLEVIMNSSWWDVPFHTGMKEECLNVSTLVKTYPKLSLQLLKKYISEDKKNVLYDFTLFEDNYWLPEDEGESPFVKSGKLHHRAIERYPESKYKNHPVTHMIQGMRNDLLHDQLTQAWLSYKWSSYICWIHCFFILMDMLHFVFLVGYMATVRNIKHISSCDEIWSQDHLETPRRFYISLYFSCIWISLQELYFIYKLREMYFTPDTAGQVMAKSFQLICTLVLIFSPLGLAPECRLSLGAVQPETAWQCGVVTVLLAWLCLLNSVNQTFMTEFLPVLKDILKIFLRVLFFVIMFVLIFAFIFNLLLKEQDNFKTFPQAVGSSLAWMILDLDYGDIFVRPQLQYPIETNIIFFLFVTTVVSLIMSLISRQSEAHVDDKQYSLSFRRVSLRVGLIFRLDICFPFVRRSYACNKWSKVNKDPTFVDKYFGNTEVTVPEKDEEGLDQSSVHEEMDRLFQMMKTFSKLLEDAKDDNALKHIKQQYKDIYALLADIKNQTKKKKYGTF
nr:transient receptor potential cation channel subfamily A member 1 homolog [Procambarus clarkii]